MNKDEQQSLLANYKKLLNEESYTCRLAIGASKLTKKEIILSKASDLFAQKYITIFTNVKYKNACVYILDDNIAIEVSLHDPKGASLARRFVDGLAAACGSNPLILDHLGERYNIIRDAGYDFASMVGEKFISHMEFERNCAALSVQHLTIVKDKFEFVGSEVTKKLYGLEKNYQNIITAEKSIDDAKTAFKNDINKVSEMGE